MKPAAPSRRLKSPSPAARHTAPSVRSRFGPEPAPQPAPGMALRRLGLRPLRRRRTGIRRARPGAATQPPLVFVRLRRPVAASTTSAVAAPAAVTTKAPKAAPGTKSPSGARSRKSSRLAPPAVATADVPTAPSPKPLSTPVTSPAGIPSIPATPSAASAVPLGPVALLEALVGGRRKAASKLPPLPPILLEGDVPKRFPRRGVSAATSNAAPGIPVPPPSPVAVRPSFPAPAVPSGSVGGPSPGCVPSLPTGSSPTWNPVNPGPEPVGVPRPDGAVWMVPRDPQTFLAFWTHSRAALDQWKSVTASGEWTWRLRGPSESGPVVASGPLPADAGFLFVPVALAGVTHVFEIGIDHGNGGWTTFAASQPVATPVGRRVVTPPSVVPGLGADLFPWTAAAVRSTAPVSVPVPSVRGLDGFRGPVGAVEPVAEEILEEVLFGGTRSTADGGSSDQSSGFGDDARTVRRVRRIPGGPGGGAEESEVPAELPAEAGSEEAGSSEQSATAAPKPRGFWFRVNAEVVLHGSTEPGAAVTIAGRPVVLRPDGSFTFRFSLPDGEYELPVVAVSPAGDDVRAASVEFRRSTRPTGDVGVHPIDVTLRPPTPAAIGPG